MSLDRSHFRSTRACAKTYRSRRGTGVCVAWIHAMCPGAGLEIAQGAGYCVHVGCWQAEAAKLDPGLLKR